MDVFPCFMGTQMGLNEKLYIHQPELLTHQPENGLHKTGIRRGRLCEAQNWLIGGTSQFGHMRMICDRIY